MRILGIDPSLKSTGYGIIDSSNMSRIISGRVFTEAGKYTNEERITKILDEIIKKASEYEVDYVMVERPIAGRLNGIKVVQDLAGIFYVLVCGLMRLGYLVIPTLPSEWKSKVGVKGKNRAEQKKVGKERVQELYGYEAKTDDESDALLIATYASMLEGEIEKGGEDE